MNQAEAVRLLTAANDDPVLAAWAFVAHHYSVDLPCDVSPYEFWEAYQSLFSLGLVSAEHYNGIDARRVFFERSPPAGEIQSVIARLRHPSPPLEYPVTNSKTKLPSNPFGDTNGTGALVARERENGIGFSNGGLPAARVTPALNPFSNGGGLNAPAAKPALNPFSNGTALPCRDEKPRTGRQLARSSDVQLEIRCCGVVLEMEVADMQAEGADGVPGGQISVIDRVLHGTCPHCEREHHHSVGEVVRDGDYR